MSPAHVAGARDRGRTRAALRAGHDQDRRRAGRADGARRARQTNSPACVQEPVSIRDYPYGEMAAQVLGYVGQISKERAQAEGLPRRPAGHDRRPGRPRVLLRPLPARQPRGRARGGQRRRLSGAQPARPDAAEGRPQPAADARPRPAAGGRKGAAGGHRQRPRAAASRRTPGRSWRWTRATGEILAIGSYPSFNPNRFAKPLTQPEYERARGQRLGGAGRSTDRAVNGTYPTGSTFKPITAMAALEAGVITPGEGLGAGQCITVSTEQFCNAGHADYGAVGLVRSAEGLLGHLLLRSRRARQQPRRRDPEQGARARHRPGHRRSTCRASSKAWCPTPPGAGTRTSAEIACEHEHPHGGCGDRQRSRAPGASATTCTSPSARATC